MSEMSETSDLVDMVDLEGPERQGKAPWTPRTLGAANDTPTISSREARENGSTSSSDSSSDSSDYMTIAIFDTLWRSDRREIDENEACVKFKMLYDPDRNTVTRPLTQPQMGRKYIVLYELGGYEAKYKCTALPNEMGWGQFRDFETNEHTGMDVDFYFPDNVLDDDGVPMLRFVLIEMNYATEFDFVAACWGKMRDSAYSIGEPAVLSDGERARIEACEAIVYG